MSKTAFVTGGTGFIGSHLVEALIQHGYDEVRCLVRSKPKWLEGQRFVPIYGDLTQPDTIKEAIGQVDYIYHLGGVTRARDWETFEKNNITATQTLLDVVRDVTPGIKKILVTSSLAVIGSCRKAVSDETTPLEPISFYGKSKAEMEHLVQRDTLPIVIVRPPAVYGPREADIYTYFRLIKYGFFPALGTPRVPSFSLVYVRDLVRGMIKAAESESTAGKTYFISSEQFYAWNEFKESVSRALGKRAVTIQIPEWIVNVLGTTVETIGRALGAYPPFNKEKAREFIEANKMCSTNKARDDLGYRQEVSLDEGIGETVAWYRENGWL